MEELVNVVMNNILASIVLVSVFTYLMVEGIKKTNRVKVDDLPFLSLFVGMVAGLILSIGFKLDIATMVAAGFISGGFASGMYDTGKNIFGGNK